jgi:hypothetical protein
MADFVHTLTIEAWTLYAMGMLLIVARLFVVPRSNLCRGGGEAVRRVTNSV